MRRWLLISLYIVAAVAVARALWLVPQQVAQLHRMGYFDRFDRLPNTGDGRLHGRVTEAWVGEPVAGVALEFARVPCGEALDDPDVAWLPSKPLEVRSDEQGRFDVAVAPGLYSVAVDSRTHHAEPLSWIFVGREAQIPSELVVVVHPLCELTVKLVDGDGESIRDAEVFVRGGDPGRAYYSRRPPGMLTTDAGGEVRWRSWCGPGTIRYVSLPGGAPSFVERPVELRTDPAVVTLTLDEIQGGSPEPQVPSTVADRRSKHPSTLKLPVPPDPPDSTSCGRVVAVVADPEGSPVDAILRLDPVDRSKQTLWYGSRFYPAYGFTQDGGQVAVDLVCPGRYRAVLYTAGQPIRTFEPFEHGAGQDTDLGPLVVHPIPSAAAQGSVLGPDGPIAGAEVYAVAIGDLGRLFVTVAQLSWSPRTVTSPDGAFRLEHLPAGDVVLVAYHADVGASTPVTVAVDGDVALDLHLEPGTTDKRTGWAEGCLVGPDSRGMLVVGVIEGTRAMAAGILPEDRIVYVDDLEARWMDKSRVFALLSGEERGLPSTVTVERPGEEELVVLQWGP